MELTSLSNRDEIIALVDDREAVLLDGGWCLVASHLDVLQHSRVKFSFLEVKDGRNSLSTLLKDVDLRNPKTF